MIAIREDEVDAERVLDLLASGRVVWLITEMADRLACDLEALEDALACLEDGGRVNCWPEAENGPAAVLGVLEAKRRGLELGPAGADGNWCKIGKHGKNAKHDKHPLLPESYDRSWGNMLDGLADPRAADPAEVIAEHDEAVARYQRARRRRSVWDELPEPTILIWGPYAWRVQVRPGGAFWPPADVRQRARESCPTCEGRPLPEGGYCFECDRYWLDDRVLCHVNGDAPRMAGSRLRGGRR